MLKTNLSFFNYTFINLTKNHFRFDEPLVKWLVRWLIFFWKIFFIELVMSFSLEFLAFVLWPRPSIYKADKIEIRASCWTINVPTGYELRRNSSWVDNLYCCWPDHRVFLEREKFLAKNFMWCAGAKMSFK